MDNAWRCEVGSGNWNASANWSLGRVPSGSDDAIINCPGDLTVTVSGGVPGAATLRNANTLQITAQGSLSAGTIQNDAVLQSSGFISGTSIRNNANFTWLGGELTYSNLRNDDLIAVLSGATHVARGGVLTNAGTIAHTEGTLTIVGTVINQNLYDFQAGTITNQNLNNADTGTLRKSTSGTATISAPFNNSGGMVEVLEGTLVFTGGGTSNDGFYAVAAGSNLLYRGSPTFRGTHFGVIEGALRLEAGSLFQTGDPAVLNFLGTGLQWVGGELNYSNLRNDGFITVLSGANHIARGGVLTNAGTIALSADGVVTVVGDYAQTAEGALAVTLASSTQFGRATIFGQARLAGDLAPNLAAGYTPAVGDEFPVLTYGSRVNPFDTCSGCDLGEGRMLNQVFTVSQLRLVAIQP